MALSGACGNSHALGDAGAIGRVRLAAMGDPPHNDIFRHALRFPDPEPSREIGLAWRKSAARKQDFVALGELLIEAMAGIEPKP